MLKLPYEDIQPNTNGIYPLYSAEGFKVAWTDRQKYLIDQVNRITQGTKQECLY
jgi:superoxide dismutase